MTTYAMPLSGEHAAKKARSTSTPPAEAPMPTTGKASVARAAKSTGADASSGAPEGVAAAARVGSRSAGLIMDSDPLGALYRIEGHSWLRCEAAGSQPATGPPLRYR